ncbi:hypothetical protein Dsin_015063 [Dipteronia sinensis]|uniref:Uncharacterized protein n=1 Tax=Dipteronia sinensis TaxID=43782 RepID=A0AAE0EAD8_9ROSI|nr:hypothetical protein Dsin_015063 [Dipteronia sinensis]
MNPSGKYFLQLMILVLLLLTIVCDAGFFFPDRVHASIENNIGSGVDLTLHFSPGQMLFMGLIFTILREIQEVVFINVTGIYIRTAHV